MRRSAVRRALRTLGFGVLLAAVGVLTAHAETAVKLTPSAPIEPGIAAFPRLVAGPSDTIIGRINRALDRGDARVRDAAKDCPGWRRSVTIAMRGPQYLSLVAVDETDCGAYPDTSRIALVYDLSTGSPVNWSDLLPMGWVTAATTDSSADGTMIGAASIPTLRPTYVGLAKPERVDPACKTVVGDDSLSFQLWPDAQADGLGMQPFGLVHAIAACGPPVLNPVAELRRLGVDALLLDAIDAAHRQGLFGLGPAGGMKQR